MKDRLILLGVMMAFVFLGVESRYLHGGMVESEPMAWVPTATAALAVIFCMLGLVGNKSMNKVLGVLFLVLSISGLVGFYFHHGGDFQTQADFDRLNTLVSSNLRADHLDLVIESPGAPDPPPHLAPLSYTGLCVLAALTLLVTRKDSSRMS